MENYSLVQADFLKNPKYLFLYLAIAILAAFLFIVMIILAVVLILLRKKTTRNKYLDFICIVH